MQTIEELRDIAEERTKLSDLNTKLGLIKENKNELANSK
jgi:predicted component of type VI protein secretion system